MKGTIYDSKTGRIMSTCQAPDEDGIKLQCTLGEDLAAYVGEELDSRHWYFLNGVPTERKPMGLVFEPHEPSGELNDTIELGKGEVLKISNIPAGMELLYPGGRVVIDDGFIDWSSETSGHYHFRFLNIPIETEEVYFDAIVG